MSTRYTGADDWNCGDTAGKNEFADSVLAAGAEQQVGRFDVPAAAHSATIGGGKVFLELMDDTTTEVREDGTFRFYAYNPTTGNKLLIAEIDSNIMAGAGQENTPSEQNFLPTHDIWAPGGGEIQMFFKSLLADTLDSTDFLFRMPITIR